MGGAMSTHRYDRFKESREENANTFGARCARYFAEDFTPDDPGASAYSTQCPCDAKDPSAPNQATGCEYLPFEQLPPEQRKVYRSKEDQVVDAVSLAFVILFVLWVFRVWHRTRREDRARAGGARGGGGGGGQVARQPERQEVRPRAAARQVRGAGGDRAERRGRGRGQGRGRG